MPQAFSQTLQGNHTRLGISAIVLVFNWYPGGYIAIGSDRFTTISDHYMPGQVWWMDAVEWPLRVPTLIDWKRAISNRGLDLMQRSIFLSNYWHYVWHNNFEIGLKQLATSMYMAATNYRNGSVAVISHTDAKKLFSVRSRTKRKSIFSASCEMFLRIRFARWH